MNGTIVKRLSAAALAALAVTSLSAADIYVSLVTGKNRNVGTKEAPLKNLWKALEKAETGGDHDAVRHVREPLPVGDGAQAPRRAAGQGRPGDQVGRAVARGLSRLFLSKGLCIRAFA